MSRISGVFVGDGTLLIRCAQSFLQAGHLIDWIATANAEICRWAGTHGITTVDMDVEHSALPSFEFDYLFSIANLRILPPGLIARARRLAINFHDGPLPRYAGLNATSWALLAQETVHGITWHEMTGTVDAGRAVRQAMFPIAASDTALSLNARCYEAGLATFESILDDIALGRVNCTGQVTGSARTYFGGVRRPEALATLDFSRTARELVAVVRALDFGPYPNPLARPKIYLGDDILLVRSARAIDTSSDAAPGTVLRVGNDAAQVATGDGDIVLEGCCDVLGRPCVAGLVEGQTLPGLNAAVRARLAERIAPAAQGESFWRKAFTELAPVELPYPRTHQQAPGGPRHAIGMPLGDCPAGGSTVGAFFAWLSAMTAQERVTVMYCDTELRAKAEGVESWLSPWVPLTLVTTPQTTANEAAECAQAQIARVRDAGPYARDLPTRLGEDYGAAGTLSRIGVCLDPTARCEFELLLTADARGDLLLLADGAVFSLDTLCVMARHLTHWLKAFSARSGPTAQIQLVPPAEAEMSTASSSTEPSSQAGRSIHEAIQAQAGRTPQADAICGLDRTLSYRELDARASALGEQLMQRGAGPGVTVGVCLTRTPDLVAAVLGILKTGAAYLPLDPDYPAERIAFMIQDSATQLVVTSSALAASQRLPAGTAFLTDEMPAAPGAVSPAFPTVAPDSPAYVIYTSGSTGRPKGVVVTHRNVMNLFAGMDARVPHDPPGRWLAVTSLSFDISVLELFWTLARGFSVVLHSSTVQVERKGPEFSLFFFASDHASSAQDRYKLMLEGAKFADAQGFCAIWTPERHFHAFGGLYPNPAVTSAAIAAVTTRLQIRAGSCVLPLHHPIRVAEEWAFVDNISHGRVGISFASGWQPNDFVIAPAAFADRKNAMLASIDVVRRLWRGEGVAFPGPLGKPVEVRTLPRPVQRELPVWLTAAGNPETFQQAGEQGCHLLTHLLGQGIDEVADKLKLYRAAWRKAGHAGKGHVTLMLHTFIGPDEDAVRETVRGPMKEYLRSSVDLIKQAAWSFPTFVQRGVQHGKSPVEIMDAQPLSDQEMDGLLEHAFARYYNASALFGTPRRCLAMVERFESAGVDEVACLIDFGIETDTVLAHLRDLKSLMDASRIPRPKLARASIGQDIADHGITHLQCTPSTASMLAADAAGRAALTRLSVLLVGGEALPLALARELRALVPGALLNMYGPTETTVWSATCDLADIGDFVALGQPITNTRLSIRTPWGMECPALVPGELLIGGDGVAQGYLNRPELTAERFIVDPGPSGGRWYRTGDLVRRHPDGRLEFLGRIDQQVKIRGHRIELGEIEASLSGQEGVQQAVVIAREDASADRRLAAYVTAHPGSAIDPEQLRAALARGLPEVMVPATITVLPALPLTPNGKVDRRALPQPQVASRAQPAAPPVGQLEQAIAAIWTDVLGLAQVGATDNFFDLGGHSLLVVQVQRRLREACGREVSITDMFRLPTIRALADHLGGNETTSAVDDGLKRANARRIMRSRAGRGLAQARRHQEN